MSVQLDDPAQAVRRDQWGRYLVVPPGKSKPVGYTRATTIAGTLDDKQNLKLWWEVMALTGLMRKPGARAQLEALMSRHPNTGPWYGTPDSKNAAKAIAVECEEAGGSTDRRDLGISRHSLIEQVHLGQPTLITQADTQADVDAYTAMLEQTGIVVDPSYCEAMVVNDTWALAGMSDMLRITVPGEGDVVGDLKTGDTLDWSHPTIAIQLAIYATADNVYRQGVTSDDDQRLPMPKVSQERALVVHLPAGEARCELHWVDISAGLEAVEHALWVRRWRKRRDLFTPYDMPPVPMRRLAAVRMADDAERTPSAVVDAPDEGGPVSDEAFAALEEWYVELPDEARAWFKQLVVEAKDAGVDFRAQQCKTERRYAIYRGLLNLSTKSHARSGIALGLVEEATGNTFANVTLGHAIGSMGAAEAATFSKLVDDYVG